MVDVDFARCARANPSGNRWISRLAGRDCLHKKRFGFIHRSNKKNEERNKAHCDRHAAENSITRLADRIM